MPALVTGNTVVDAQRWICRRYDIRRESSATGHILVTAHRREHWGDAMAQTFEAVADVAAATRFYETIAPHAGLEVRRHTHDHTQLVGSGGSFSLLAGEHLDRLREAVVIQRSRVRESGIGHQPFHPPAREEHLFLRHRRVSQRLGAGCRLRLRLGRRPQDLRELVQHRPVGRAARLALGLQRSGAADLP